MPETVILIQDATPTERKLAKGMLDSIARREQLIRDIVTYQSQVTTDEKALVDLDADLLPALEASFPDRGWARIDAVERTFDGDKFAGLKFTHP